MKESIQTTIKNKKSQIAIASIAGASVLGVATMGENPNKSEKLDQVSQEEKNPGAAPFIKDAAQNLADTALRFDVENGKVHYASDKGKDGGVIATVKTEAVPVDGSAKYTYKVSMKRDSDGNLDPDTAYGFSLNKTYPSEDSQSGTSFEKHTISDTKDGEKCWNVESTRGDVGTNNPEPQLTAGISKSDCQEDERGAINAMSQVYEHVSEFEDLRNDK